MTTIRDLLKQDFKRIEVGLQFIANENYNHVSEIQELQFESLYLSDGFCPDIESVVFHEQSWRKTKGQRIFGVRFHGEWVMLCYNAGTKFGDYSRKQIINKIVYRRMIDYIKLELAKLPTRAVSLPEVNLDDDVDFTFFGHDIRYPYHSGF